MGYSSQERKWNGVVYWGWAAILVLTASLAAMGQNVVFYDDFSGGLTNWQELGNPGNPTIVDGKVQLEWGHAPNWFTTKQSFDFGSKGYKVDLSFLDGGFQSSANVKVQNMQPLLGASNPSAETNGAVRVQFSYKGFSMERQYLDANAATAWKSIKLAKNTAVANTIKPGSRIKIVVDSDGLQGSYAVDGEAINRFRYLGSALEGGFGFRSVVQRNLIVDDVRFYQIAADGKETDILTDDFNRTELGSKWVNETLAADVTPGPLAAAIKNGQLYIENDGSGDTWLRTADQATFSGKTTVFEFTFVDYLGTVIYNPSVVVGTKPFVAGQTNGVLLFDNGAGFTYAVEGGSWTSGRVQGQANVADGMRFKVVVDQGAQSGKSYINGIEVARFKTLGPTMSGSFAFRSIVDRDAAIDDLRIYTVDDAGAETTVFEDNFNRDDVGANWVVESITPGGLIEALAVFTYDSDGDGDKELYLDHDETLEDNWCRLTKDLPYGEKDLVIEGTYANMTNGYPSVVIGAQPWKENQTVGPLLLDSISAIYGMDTRGGGVWVQNGPIAGIKVSMTVNADGRSGSLMTNDVTVTEWAIDGAEAAIPAGAIGVNDPYATIQANVAPSSGNAVAVYDDIRVTQLGGTSVRDWMIE